MNVLKKACISSRRVTGIVLIIIAIIAFLFLGRNIFKFIGGGTIDANSDLSKYDGKIVTLTMTNTVDIYEEITDSKKKPKFNGYAVMVNDENSDKDGYYMGVWRPVSKESEMETYMDDIWSYWFDGTDKPVAPKVTGVLVKMDAEDKGYMNEFLEFYDEYGMGGEAQYYYIIEGMGNKDADESITLAIIVSIICGVLILISIIIICTASAGWDNKLKFYAQSKGITMDALAAEANSGTFFSNSMIVGNNNTFFFVEGKARALDLKQVCWGYHYLQRGRYTVSQLILCDVAGNLVRMTCSEPLARDILNCIAKKCPWVIVGYKAEWEKMYKKQRDEFLRLHYYDGKQQAGEVVVNRYEDPIDAFEREQAAAQAAANPAPEQAEAPKSDNPFADFAEWTARQNNENNDNN